MKLVRAFASHAEGWVFEFRPRHTKVVKQVVKAPLPNDWQQAGVQGSSEMIYVAP